MTQQIDMTELIATRTLYTVVGDETRQITIQFRKPCQQANGDWMCECIIEGSGVTIEPPHPGMGVDSVQAIIGALQSAGAALEKSNLVVALSPSAFLNGTIANWKMLGDFLPRKIDVNCALFDQFKRPEGGINPTD